MNNMIFKNGANYTFYGVFLQVFLSFAVSLTTMADGLFTGWTSYKIAELTNENATPKITLQQASYIGMIPILVYILIMPIAIYSSNHFGRKWTIIWGALNTFSSWLILYFLEDIEYIYIAVAIQGVGGFVVYTVPQIYISEIAQANIRGLLGSLIPILMNFGIFLSYIGVTYMSLHNLTIIGFASISIMLPMLIFAPKSPYFLYMKNKSDEAKQSLQKFRGTDDIQTELDDIKSTLIQNNLESNSIKDFFKDKICRKVSIIVIPLQIFQQTAGFDTILLFLHVILQSSESTLSSNHCSIIFGAGNLFACTISLLLVDVLGRRILLIVSCIASLIPLALLGLFFYVKDVLLYDISTISWAPLSLLMVYVVGYSIGLGTVPFILPTEMYPTRYKSLGYSIVQIFYCISVISVSQLFVLMESSYGFHVLFWFLSLMTTAGLIFTIYCVYETKGKSFKQILIELES